MINRMTSFAPSKIECTRRSRTICSTESFLKFWKFFGITWIVLQVAITTKHLKATVGDKEALVSGVQLRHGAEGGGGRVLVVDGGGGMTDNDSWRHQLRRQLGHLVLQVLLFYERLAKSLANVKLFFSGKHSLKLSYFHKINSKKPFEHLPTSRKQYWRDRHLNQPWQYWSPCLPHPEY